MLHADGNRKRKQKAPLPSGSRDSNDDDDDDDAMDVDDLKASEHCDFQNSAVLDMCMSDEMFLMPQVESTTVLKDGLYARMVALRRSGAQNNEPEDRDGLLEERRKERAALRLKCRKEGMQKV